MFRTLARGYVLGVVCVVSGKRQVRRRPSGERVQGFATDVQSGEDKSRARSKLTVHFNGVLGASEEKRGQQAIGKRSRMMILVHVNSQVEWSVYLVWTNAFGR